MKGNAMDAFQKYQIQYHRDKQGNNEQYQRSIEERKRVIMEQMNNPASKERIDQLKQEILNQKKPSVQEVLNRDPQGKAQPQSQPQLPINHYQRSTSNITSSFQVQATPQLNQKETQNKTDENRPMTPYQPLQVETVGNAYSNIIVNTNLKDLSPEFKTQQLYFNDDDILFEYQMVQDVITLLLGGGVGNFISFDKESQQLDCKYNQQKYPNHKIIVEKLLGQIPRQRAQIEQFISDLSKTQLHALKYYGNIIIHGILKGIDESLVDISQGQVYSLVELEIQLYKINTYQVFETLANIIKISPYQLDYIGSQMQKQVTTQIYHFFILNYLLPYLQTGKSCQDLLCINQQSNIVNYIQPDMYIQKQMNYLDKIGQSIIIIARNSRLLQHSKEKITDIAGNLLINKNAVTLFFLEDYKSSILQNIFMEQFEIDNLHKFYFYIQQLETLSQKIILKMYKQNSLLSVINSLNNMYLIQKSDVIELFVEQSYQEIKRTVAIRQNADISKIKNLFDYIYRITNNWQGQNAVKYSIEISNLTFMQLIQKVNGLEITQDNIATKLQNILRLSCVIKNPLIDKMLNTDEYMSKYELIFRRLFREKAAEIELNMAYKCLLKMKLLQTRSRKRTNILTKFSFVYELMEKMQSFMKKMLLYNQIGVMTIIQKLHENIAEAISIDEINRCINTYLDDVLGVLLLKENETITLMDNIFADILVYSRYIQEHFNFIDDTVRDISKESMQQLRNEKIKLFIQKLDDQIQQNKKNIQQLRNSFVNRVETWQVFK